MSANVTARASIRMNDFAEIAAAISKDQSAWWVKLKSANAKIAAGEPAGSEYDALMIAGERIRERTEAARRKFFPRAHRLVISDGTAITVSKTGRSTRLVWSAR